MATHFEYDANYNCRAQVHVGRRTATVERLEQSLTYAGLLEGLPTKKSNDRTLDWIRRDAGSTGVILIEPARRDFLRRPGDMSRVASIRDEPPEWLPMVHVSMTLSAPGDSGNHCSVLRVIFFQDDFAPPLDESVAAALQDVDWERHAQQVEL